ncbi:hypothetical protein D3C75_567580 [compost metagenome]
MWCIAVIEGHTQLFPSPLNRFKNFLTFLFIHCHRFLRNNIAAKLHRPDNVTMMRAVNTRDNNRVRFGFLNHTVKLMSFIGRNRLIFIFFLQQTVRIIHSCSIHITKAYNLRGFTIIRSDLTIKKLRSAAGSYESIFLVGHQDHSITY